MSDTGVVAVRSVDRVAAVSASLLALATLVAAVGAYAFLSSGQLLYGLSYTVVTFALGLFGWIWWARRTANITADSTGLSRDGRFRWHLSWPEITTADLRKVSSLAGPQDCLILTITDAARQGRVATSARTSKTFRWGLPTRRNTLVIPVDTADARALTEHVEAHLSA